MDNIPTLEQAIAQIEQGEASLPGLQANLESINNGLAQMEDYYNLAIQYYDQLVAIEITFKEL